MSKREKLKAARRIVVKVGTSTLTHSTGKMNLWRMETLVRELADLANQGHEMALVTSAAIAMGRERLHCAGPLSIAERQVMAAVGQGALMHLYEKLFAEYGQTTAQILLTRENSVRHNQYSNSRQALLRMLEMHVIPIINENDAVSVDELKIGDNDTLSAMVASLIDADLLILLSDVDGLYTANPATHPEATLIGEVRDITADIEALAGGAGTAVGTGGMVTKLQAAKIAHSTGVDMVITNGGQPGMVRRVLDGEAVGTLFPATESHLRVRKSWLAFGRHIEGDITVDEGCARAMLTHGSSLLPVGMVGVEGEFAAQATVRVLTAGGREIARGIANYSADELRRVCGCQTKDLASRLPAVPCDEAIHRDNMVIMR